MTTAITVEGLGKRYRIGHTVQRATSAKQAVRNAALSPFRYLKYKLSRQTDEDTIWAVKDVSFEVKEGEVLGIIGGNGAGKSTLLKILSRITDPTVGHAVIRGRVNSLLEVGVGFNPELTGRENVYMNAALHGLKRREIRRILDPIVDFSGIEKFLDTPVKRYSSGMKVRLGFAVAAHLDPEILIVDEVLAVGDATFQKKALGKMSDVTREGRTVLFVSHNMIAVQSLCGKGIWLDEGRMRMEGDAGEVVSEYLSSGLGTQSMERVWDEPGTAPGSDGVRIQAIRIRLEDGSVPREIGMDTPFCVEICYWQMDDGCRYHPNLLIVNEQGVMAFTTSGGPALRAQDRGHKTGFYRCVCRMPGNLFNSGTYFIGAMIVKDGSHSVWREDSLLSVLIMDKTRREAGWQGKAGGVLRPKLDWDVEHEPAFMHGTMP